MLQSPTNLQSEVLFQVYEGTNCYNHNKNKNNNNNINNTQQAADLAAVWDSSSPEGMDAVDDSRHVLTIIQVSSDRIEDLKKKKIDVVQVKYGGKMDYNAMNDSVKYIYTC